MLNCQKLLHISGVMSLVSGWMQDSPVICVTEYMPGGDLERYYIAAWHQRLGGFEGDLAIVSANFSKHANTFGLTRPCAIALSYLG